MSEKLEAVFGRVVRRLREARGISQEDFADVAGIHRTYVSSIERGKVQVSIAVVKKLADALEVSLTDLWSQVDAELSGPKPSGGGSKAVGRKK